MTSCEDFDRSFADERKRKKSLWEVLERLAGSAHHGVTWRSLLKADYPVVREAFLRYSSDPAVQIAALKSGSGTVLLYPMDAERIEPNCKEDLLCLELDVERLGSAVARAFDLPPKISPMKSLPNTWQIAELSSLPIILTVQQEAEAFRGVVAELAAKRRTPFALLAPTRQHMDADTEELLVPCRAGFFDLEAQLTLLDSGRLTARKSGGELFAPLLPEQRDALNEAEAIRLFKFMEKLEDESDQRRKAPLQKVFRLLVLKKWSKSEVAEKCKCTASLITLRVGELEDKMGLKLDQMLTLSSRLNEMQAEKDSRAKYLYRQGLAKGSEG